MEGAYMAGANLEGANMAGANLAGAKLPHFQICPQEGDFIGWKALSDCLIAKLLITGARTSTLVGRKCRTSEAKVLSIQHRSTGEFVSQGVSCYNRDFIYNTGGRVTEPGYDDDIRIDCTNGIHFFMTRAEAFDYAA
jgi:hypothetical protein